MAREREIYWLAHMLLNNNRKKLIILLCLLVFTSLFILSILDYNDYRDIIKKDIKNIAKLISTNIYSEIQIELTKPIFVSLTMANNIFLKDWLMNENNSDKDKIFEYLQNIKNQYNYDSVFLISDISKNYYHHSKILKQIKKDDPHDVWYYKFLAAGLQYDLDVDTDQADKDDLTLFVNSLVQDNKDNLLGVAGVGLKIESISDILEEYNKNLNVEISLISPDGIVQINAHEHIIENYNIFEDPEINNLKYDILSEKQELKIFELGNKFDSNYLISFYIEELDWYLIVQKDTLILRKSLQKQIIKKAIIFLLAFGIVSLSIIKIINFYQKKNIKLATTDTLTNLNNRNAFDEYLDMIIAKTKLNHEKLTIIIIDIDNFKNINDKYGHIKGDEVLKGVADYLKRLIRTEDILARWGGDEFALILKCDLKMAKMIIKRIKDCEIDNAILDNFNITISIGMTEFQNNDTTDSILKRADQALYQAKSNGKDNVCFL